jgi:predicted TIM-barrel fold metal-dependent hydrolase
LKLLEVVEDVFSESKIDCHVHVLDPARFPYAADTHYRPTGQELATAAQLLAVMDAYGAEHALIVGPNSGYGLDNRCLIDAIAHSAGRCKGIAVVANDASRADLEALKDAGIVGVAWNVTHYGVDYYLHAAELLDKLSALDLCVQVQVEHDQLVPLVPMLERSGARILIDHCGRPTPAAGLDQPGFKALLRLAATRRAFVKLSGIVKFSREPFPHHDARPYIDALIDAFTPDGCMWASDWPFLRAPGRADYGVLLALVLHWLPDATQRHQVLWKTPDSLFRFTA